MSNTRTLHKPYPKEKNPFHDDVKKSRSRIMRTFSNVKESLRQSFRKKPESQPINASDSSRIVPLRPKPIEPQEEFVIRTRIPDRYAAMIEASNTRHTVAATSTPVPPPRTSSMRKRNHLNSISSGCSSTTNPFNDDVTPLFPDKTAMTQSRHTLNIPPHGHGGMYGSHSILRTSCESICTVGGTRRRKRIAPQPPMSTFTTLQQSFDAQDDSCMLDKGDYNEQVQRLQIDIEQMNEELKQRAELLDDCRTKESENVTSKDEITTDDCEGPKSNINVLNDDTGDDDAQELIDDRTTKQDEEISTNGDITTSTDELLKADTDISYDNATVPCSVKTQELQEIAIKLSNKEFDENFELLNGNSEISEELPKPKENDISIVDGEMLRNGTNNYISLGLDEDDTDDNSIPVEYVATEIIVLKRCDSQRDSNANEIHTQDPIELSTFQRGNKKAGESELIPNLPLFQRRKARFETETVGDVLRNEYGSSDFQHDQKQNATTDETNKADAGVDINFNELHDTSVATVREKLKGEEAQMRYIDDDRDDILEIEEPLPNVEKRFNQ